MKTINSIGLVVILFLGAASSAISQVQLSFQGSNVSSGSVNQLNVPALNTDHDFTIDIVNTSATSQNYTVTRKKIVNPSSWIIVKSIWENPNTGVDVYCYPSSSDVIWTTFNQIPTASNTNVFFQDFVQTSNDSCAHYRYYINSTQNGIEDSLDVMFCHVVGIEESFLTSLSLYPNPASEILTIESEVLIDNISLFDNNGKALYSSSIQSLTTSIPIIDLQNGIYFVDIESDSGIIERRKFIVSR